MEDEAEHLEHAAELLEAEKAQLLQAALSHSQNLSEAHELLASYFRDRHQRAEGPGQAAAAARWSPFGSMTAGPTRSISPAACRLSSRPSPAARQLWRYTLRRRRLVPVLEDQPSTPWWAPSWRSAPTGFKIQADGCEEGCTPCARRGEV